MKITATFNGGHKRVLKSPEELKNIDKNREALFVMDNTAVYEGRCDGEVDEDGNFGVWKMIHGITLPFKRLIGWCYKTKERRKKNDYSSRF